MNQSVFSPEMAVKMALGAQAHLQKQLALAANSQSLATGFMTLAHKEGVDGAIILGLANILAGNANPIRSASPGSPF